jgi:hypothetical protein
MTALSKLVGGPAKPWPKFTDKYPVKVKVLKPPEGFLQQITKDILEAGDHLQGRTPAKCLMTRWDMHRGYETFKVLGAAAAEIANTCPVSKRTDTKGNPLPVPLFVKESWGLVYVKGNQTEEHNHWPSLWSYTFCVNACESCAPLVFPTCEHEYSVDSMPAQLILFPAWVMHEVPPHTCDHERIMVAGNLNIREDEPSAA